MPENPENQKESDKSAGKPVEGKLEIRAAAKVASSAQVRIRLIQHSPVADPKLVEEARKFARELKEKDSQKEDLLNSSPEAPLILPVQK